VQGKFFKHVQNVDFGSFFHIVTIYSSYYTYWRGQSGLNWTKITAWITWDQWTLRIYRCPYKSPIYCLPTVISPIWHFTNLQFTTMTICQITIHQHHILPTWHFINMTIRQHDNPPTYNSPTWHSPTF
jgi:hypothetical protein